MNKNDYPPLLLDLLDHLKQQLIGKGIDPIEAASAASSSVQYISEHWRGSLIYMPSQSKVKKNERNKTIIQKFNGKNYHELGLEFGLSEVRIRQIIKVMQSKQ
ncbi:MAG: Mor transcription activator family protein [Methylococcales bacterium]